MKTKTKEKWSIALICFGAVIFLISVATAALVYKLNPSYESNTLFILSVIGIVTGIVSVAGGASIVEDSFSSDTFHFHDYQ